MAQKALPKMPAAESQQSTVDTNEFLADLSAFIAYAQSVAQEVAQSLRFYPSKSAIERLTQLIEHLQLIVQCLIEARNMQAQMPEEEWSEAKMKLWQKAEEALAQATMESMAAFERRDFILVADLLEAKLIGALSSWQVSIGFGESGNC